MEAKRHRDDDCIVAQRPNRRSEFRWRQGLRLSGRRPPAHTDGVLLYYGRQRRDVADRRAETSKRDVTSISKQKQCSHTSTLILPTLQLPHRLANHRRVERELNLKSTTFRLAFACTASTIALPPWSPTRLPEMSSSVRDVERPAASPMARAAFGPRVVAEDELLERLGGSDRLCEADSACVELTRTPPTYATPSEFWLRSREVRHGELATADAIARRPDAS